MSGGSGLPRRGAATSPDRSTGDAPAKQPLLDIGSLMANHFSKSASSGTNDINRHATPPHIAHKSPTPKVPSMSPLPESARTPESMDADDAVAAQPETVTRPPTSEPLDDTMAFDFSPPALPSTPLWPAASTSASHPAINHASMQPTDSPSAPAGRLDSAANIDTKAETQPSADTVPKQLSAEDTALLTVVASLRVALWERIQLILWERYANFYASVPDCRTFYMEYLSLPRMPAWEQDAFVEVNLVPEPGSYEEQRDWERLYTARLSGKAGGLQALRKMRRAEQNGIFSLCQVYVDARQGCWAFVASRMRRPGEEQKLRDRWEELTKDQRGTVEVAQEDPAAGSLLPEDKADDEADDDVHNGMVVGPDENKAVQVDPDAATHSYVGKGKRRRLE